MAAHTHDLVLLESEELDQRLSDSRRELFNLRFQLATGQLDNPARVGFVRREVARILTVLREREILEAEGLYVAPTEEEHEAARARLAAEAAAAEAAAAARASTDEGTSEADEPDQDDMDDQDDQDDMDDMDDGDEDQADVVDQTEEEA